MALKSLYRESLQINHSDYAPSYLNLLDIDTTIDEPDAAKNAQTHARIKSPGNLKSSKKFQTSLPALNFGKSGVEVKTKTKSSRPSTIKDTLNLVLRKFSLGFGKSKPSQDRLIIPEIIEPESPEIISSFDKKPFNRHVHISQSMNNTRKPDLLLIDPFRGRNKSDSDLGMLQRAKAIKYISTENLFSSESNHVVWLEALMENFDNDEKTEENSSILDDDVFEDAIENFSPVSEYSAKISQAIWYVDFGDYIQEKDMHLDNEIFVDMLYERAKKGPVTEL